MKSNFFTHLLICFFIFNIAQPAKSQNALSVAQNFNVFVEQNTTLANGSSQAGIATGNNLTMKGFFTVSTQNVGRFKVNNQPITLVVGNQIAFESSTGSVDVAQNGFIKIANGSNINIANTDTNTQIAQTNAPIGSNVRLNLQGIQPNSNPVLGQVIDFQSAFATLRSKSMGFSTCQNNVSTQNLSINRIVLRLTVGRENVWNVSGADLKKIIGEINFSTLPSATTPLLINVDAQGIFDWQIPSFSGVSPQIASHILFNFYNATQINITGHNRLLGAILAPNATLVKNNIGEIVGQIVVQNYQHQQGEVHDQPFLSNSIPCTDQSLPVSLIYFKATKSKNTIDFVWQTAAETNNAHFIVERTQNPNGSPIETICSLNAQNKPSKYTISDQNPSKGIAFYRLVQVDVDGKRTSFEWQKINYTLSQTLRAVAYPNPAKDVLNIRILDTENEVFISLLNAQGQTVYSNQTSGNASVEIETQPFESGIYTLKIVGNEQTVTQKISVVR